MATTVTLTWTPAGGANSSSQDVQYRVSGTSNWTTFQNVGATVNTLAITGLSDNTKYDFQIVDNCVVGGPVASAPYTNIKFTCPTPGFTTTYNSIQYTFNALGGSVDSYVVNLLDTNNNLVATQTITSPPSVIVGSFTGLNALTTYWVQIIPLSGTMSGNCAAVQTSTPNVPTCDPPSNITATLS
jgi:hypothetical protein